MPSIFLNKILLKLERIIGLSLFNRKIYKKIQYTFGDLLEDQHIYTTNKDIVYISFLKQHPEFIKNHNLVFTNKKWDKNNL